MNNRTCTSLSSLEAVDANTVIHIFRWSLYKRQDWKIILILNYRCSNKFHKDIIYKRLKNNLTWAWSIKHKYTLLNKWFLVFMQPESCNHKSQWITNYGHNNEHFRVSYTILVLYCITSLCCKCSGCLTKPQYINKYIDTKDIYTDKSSNPRNMSHVITSYTANVTHSLEDIHSYSHSSV